MAEYIEREALIDDFNSYGSHFAYGVHRVAAIISRIKLQPAADVVEVVHGEWKQNPYCKRIYYCSVCGRHIEDCTGNQNEHFPYCHCGAKMDGVENNQNHG